MHSNLQQNFAEQMNETAITTSAQLYFQLKQVDSKLRDA